MAIGIAHIEIDPDVEDTLVEAEGYGKQEQTWFEVAITRVSYYRVEATNADEALDAVIEGYVEERWQDTIDHEIQEV